MTIDPAKVKEFWDARAETYGQLDFASIANLEQDPENLALKVRLESEKVFDYLGDLTGKTIVDLGAGVGQWAFRFADRGARHVTAVEYSAALAEVGQDEVNRRGLHDTIDFHVSPAEEFRSDQTFDVVWISGLFVYLNDDQAAKLMNVLPQLCGPGSQLFLRDGTARVERYEIRDRRSDHLQANYSATYRTVDEYRALFAENGFRCTRQENMFDEGSVLNKYDETRLGIFAFVQD